MDKCLIWKASLDDCGYGIFKRNGKLRRAHKVLWELFNGKVPDGLELDHLCRNRTCINPKHLEAVTHRKNCQRGLAGTTAKKRQISKTHCPKGHPYSEENTYTAPKTYIQNKAGRGYSYKPKSPSRHCIICKYEANKRWLQKTKQK